MLYLCFPIKPLLVISHTTDLFYSRNIIFPFQLLTGTINIMLVAFLMLFSYSLK